MALGFFLQVSLRHHRVITCLPCFECSSTFTLVLRKALQHTREGSYAHSKARPQHWELRAVLFWNSAWVLLRPENL